MMSHLFDWHFLLKVAIAIIAFIALLFLVKRHFWADWKVQARDWLDNHFIPGWDKAYKLLSVKFDLYAGAAVMAWLAVPDDQRQALADALHISPLAVMLAGIAVRLYLRVKQQPELHKDEQ